MKYAIILSAFVIAGCISSNDESRPEDGVYGIYAEPGKGYSVEYKLDYPNISKRSFLEGDDPHILESRGTYAMSGDTIFFQIKEIEQITSPSGTVEVDVIDTLYLRDDCLFSGESPKGFCRQ